MPEGDTVWLTCHRLTQALQGDTVIASDFRLPQLATASLNGYMVSDVVARGKHILLHAISPQAHRITLHSHLRMNGSWHLYQPGQRWRGPLHQVRVVINTAHWVAVGYHIHDVVIVSTADETALTAHLGPDLLGLDWDESEALRRLLTQPQRPIAPALLDQRNLAGIGNLYKSEVLFMQKVWPWKPVGEITQLVDVVRLTQRLLSANRDRAEQSTTGLLRPGQDHWVYERAGKPCRRCGTSISRLKQSPAGGPDYQARSTYWCPQCQPPD